MMMLGQRSAGRQVGVLSRQTAVRLRTMYLTTFKCPSPRDKPAR